MFDRFQSLADTAYGASEVVRPLIGPRYGPPPAIGGDALDLFGVDGRGGLLPAQDEGADLALPFDPLIPPDDLRVYAALASLREMAAAAGTAELAENGVIQPLDSGWPAADQEAWQGLDEPGFDGSLPNGTPMPSSQLPAIGETIAHELAAPADRASGMRAEAAPQIIPQVPHDSRDPAQVGQALPQPGPDTGPPPAREGEHAHALRGALVAELAPGLPQPLALAQALPSEPAAPGAEPNPARQSQLHELGSLQASQVARAGLNSLPLPPAPSGSASLANTSLVAPAAAEALPRTARSSESRSAANSMAAEQQAVDPLAAAPSLSGSVPAASYADRGPIVDELEDEQPALSRAPRGALAAAPQAQAGPASMGSVPLAQSPSTRSLAPHGHAPGHARDISRQLSPDVDELRRIDDRAASGPPALLASSAEAGHWQDSGRVLSASETLALPAPIAPRAQPLVAPALLPEPAPAYSTAASTAHAEEEGVQSLAAAPAPTRGSRSIEAAHRSAQGRSMPGQFADMNRAGPFADGKPGEGETGVSKVLSAAPSSNIFRISPNNHEGTKVRRFERIMQAFLPSRLRGKSSLYPYLKSIVSSAGDRQQQRVMVAAQDVAQAGQLEAASPAQQEDSPKQTDAPRSYAAGVAHPKVVQPDEASPAQQEDGPILPLAAIGAGQPGVLVQRRALDQPRIAGGAFHAAMPSAPMPDTQPPAALPALMANPDVHPAPSPSDAFGDAADDQLAQGLRLHAAGPADQPPAAQPHHLLLAAAGAQAIELHAAPAQPRVARAWHTVESLDPPSERPIAPGAGRSRLNPAIQHPPAADGAAPDAPADVALAQVAQQPRAATPLAEAYSADTAPSMQPESHYGPQPGRARADLMRKSIVQPSAAERPNPRSSGLLIAQSVDIAMIEPFSAGAPALPALALGVRESRETAATTPATLAPARASDLARGLPSAESMAQGRQGQPPARADDATPAPRIARLPAAHELAQQTDPLPLARPAPERDARPATPTRDSASALPMRLGVAIAGGATRGALAQPEQPPGQTGTASSGELPAMVRGMRTGIPAVVPLLRSSDAQPARLGESRLAQLPPLADRPREQADDGAPARVHMEAPLASARLSLAPQGASPDQPRLHGAGGTSAPGIAPGAIDAGQGLPSRLQQPAGNPSAMPAASAQMLEQPIHPRYAPSYPPPTARRPPLAAPPVMIQVTIGRVEVRSAAPEPVARRVNRPRPTPSLDDYLRGER